MLPEGTRFLSICSSFRRPGMLQDMLGTFYANRSQGTEIFLYLHEDDPYLADYKKFISLHHHVIGPHRNLQQVVNHVVFELFPGIPNYQILVDDHLIHTKHWDALLRDALDSRAGGWGFSCGKDGANHGNWEEYKHPSAEIWTWKMAKTLGYVYPRNMEAMQLDYYTKGLGLAIDGLVFVPDVFIEHLWYGGCGKPMDLNIREKYNNASVDRAERQFYEWERTEKMIAVGKINKAKKDENSNSCATV
jgi:hypothetical protein